MSLIKVSNAIEDGAENVGLFDTFTLKPKRVLHNSPNFSRFEEFTLKPKKVLHSSGQSNIARFQEFNLKPKSVLWKGSEGFKLNNMEHVSFDGAGAKTYGRNAQGQWPLEGDLVDGWNYCEFAASNWANVAAGYGVFGDATPRANYYGRTGNEFAWYNGTRVAMLFKLPEAILWFGTESYGWFSGDPTLWKQTNGAQGAGQQIDDTHAQYRWGRMSGTKSGTTTFYVYDGSGTYPWTLTTILGLT